MREIEFRIRCRGGSWYYGVPLTKVKNDTVGFQSFDGNYYDLFADAKTLGQYIGLTDKNGTKIFEGDIIRVDWLNACETKVIYSTNHLVGFENGVFGAYIDNEFMGFNECFSGDPRYQPYTYEVIGNIYDNKMEEFYETNND